MPRTVSLSGTNLPAELTSFVGRRRELGEVKRLLGESRLVTLTGVGGTGKTRLAVRTAARLRRAFPDGVWFVDLTALSAPQLLVPGVQDPDVLADLVMVALGVREQPGAGSPIVQLVGHLAGRRTMLVLDNCEHLLPVGAVLVDTLLLGCPRLGILATSREPLSLASEVIFGVPPLPIPELGTHAGVTGLDRYEAVALFIARARAVAPDFALTETNAGVVAELCRRLDGLPLAIELAAVRVRALAPGQILHRLTERFKLLSRGSRAAPERQQTLRACADWSFELCAKPERLLWARLSVFAGGCELDAIEAICADEALPVEDVVEVVARLVDKSILVRDDQDEGTARYRMLETLRDYGRDRLIEDRERDELRRRHRDWYTNLVHLFEADIISRRQPDWFARLDRELPDIRAALEFSLADPAGAEKALAAAADLHFYWVVRGLHSEGRSWTNQALARPADSTMTRLKTLYLDAALASAQGDFPAAIVRMRQGYEVAAKRGDSLAYAFADAIRGVTEMGGDLAEATQAWQRAAAGFAAESGDEYLLWRVNALTGVAMTRTMSGHTAGAAADREAILAICQPRGETWHAGFSLWTLGLGMWRQGDLHAAAARLRESVRGLREVNDTLGTAMCLDTLAWIAYDKGQPERAATLLGVTTRLAHDMGARPALFPELATHHEQYEQRTRDALGEHAYRTAIARGERLSLDQAVTYALDDALPPAAVPPPTGALTALTRREQQVAELIAQGLSNREIAASLIISQRTAESHVEHILTKLGLNNRAQVAAWIAPQR